MSIPATSLLLRSYTFRFYSYSVLTHPIEDRDRAIIISSTAVGVEAERIEALCFKVSFAHFETLLADYALQFNSWLQLDKERVVKPFINKYQQLRMLRQEADTNCSFYAYELKQLVDRSYLVLLSQIAGLGGDEAIQAIDTTPTPLPDLSYHASFRADSTEVFWASFEELFPSYEPLIPLLYNFIYCYVSLVPHRVDLHSNLIEAINIEGVRAGITARTIGLTEIRVYMRYIITATKALDSEANEVAIDALFLPLLSNNNAIALVKSFFTTLLAHYDQLTLEVQRMRQVATV